MSDTKELVAGLFSGNDLTESQSEDLLILISVLPEKGKRMTPEQIDVLREFLMEKLEKVPEAQEVIAQFKEGKVDGPNAASALLNIASKLDAPDSPTSKMFADLAGQSPSELQVSSVITACIKTLPKRKALLARALMSRMRIGGGADAQG